MSIGERIISDMKAAMTAREQTRLDTIRLIRAELLRAEKEKGLALTPEREIDVLQKMLKQRRESIDQFQAAGRADLADKERAEAVIIEAYLPASLTGAEIDAVIDEVLAAAGTPDPKQFGRLTGQVMAQLKATGRPFDGKSVNDRIRSRLS